MTDQFGDLELLLKASAKDQVVKICEEAFLLRHKSPRCVPDNVVNSTAEKLGVDKSSSRSLLVSLGHVISSAVFLGSSDPKTIITIFPDNFHKNLRDLLTKIFMDHMAGWKTQAAGGLVSLPKMVDFDWRVDVKTSSDTVARMSVPTCILNMQVQDTATDVGIVPDVSSVNVELSKETLDTMLDGLSKIRDQLSSVASR
ncbi:COMM domain-containing protein 9-like [Haliotis asinina]|uniref:COMM domain-containing protein 9-like n=1 Tax=Haliotis asinina TaxID=109174 RepID=UPI003531E25C